MKKSGKKKKCDKRSANQWWRALPHRTMTREQSDALFANLGEEFQGVYRDVTPDGRHMVVIK